MSMNSITNEIDKEKFERIERGKRIKNIRENELHMTKTDLARIIGVSSQFLGLVEGGKGNLVYKSIKKLKAVSGHSADFILYGVDDDILEETNKLLQKYSEYEIISTINMIKNITDLIEQAKLQ